MTKVAVCYHCGLPLPDGVAAPRVVIDGEARPMCCAGCQSVAQAIVDGGLAEYYRHRDAMPESPREALPASLRELGLFDHPEVQKGFVRPIGEHEREASLLLEGITCAACVWLNESHLGRQPGVTAVEVNYATRRARVRWDAKRTRLSDILAAIASIGYHAHPYDPGRSEQLAGRERRAMLLRLAVAGLGMMQVMMYAIPTYIAEDGSLTSDVERLLHWASLVLTLPVVLYSAGPFFLGAWRDLRIRRAGMDVPIAVGVGSAFAASVWATLAGNGAVYFDSVSMFMFFLLGGRYLELMARQRAVRGVERMARASPPFAERLVRYPSPETERVPSVTLAPGEFVMVRPGELFPADGTVVDGRSEADESLLTGEAQPVAKSPGDPVVCASVNAASPLVMRVDQIGEGTRIASIQRLMERAAAERPKIAELADRVAAWFVGAVLLLASAAGVWWWSVDATQALPVFVAVLVVSCPCALSLATPMALTVATGALSKLGVLVTRGQAIETLAGASHFVFDKTGTLTRGRLRLGAVVPLANLDERAALAIARGLERASEHAIGAGLASAPDAESPVAVADSLQAVPGQGVEGLILGRRYRIGRLDFVGALHGVPVPEDVRRALEEGATVALLGSDTGWVALFRFQDDVRGEASALVDSLHRAGRRVSILSGDTAAAVARVAARLGIAEAHGGLRPEDKHAHIERMQGAGERVAMVGDGINDAPVLARAHVSIAMGGGTELARTQADMILLGDRLGALERAIALSARTMAIIRQNIGWAIAYNIVALPLAVLGWVTPWLAGIGMSASSLVVVLNALRLAREVPDQRIAPAEL